MIVDAVSIVRNANVVMEAVVTASVTMILGSPLLPVPHLPLRSGLPLPKQRIKPDLVDPRPGTHPPFPLEGHGQGQGLDLDLQLRR